jgi:hypothetical protein
LQPRGRRSRPALGWFETTWEAVATGVGVVCNQRGCGRDRRGPASAPWADLTPSCTASFSAQVRTARDRTSRASARPRALVHQKNRRRRALDSAASTAWRGLRSQHPLREALAAPLPTPLRACVDFIHVHVVGITLARCSEDGSKQPTWRRRAPVVARAHRGNIAQTRTQTRIRTKRRAWAWCARLF